MKSKSLEGVRQVKMMQTQALVSSFQVGKKSFSAGPDRRCSVLLRRN